MARSARCDVRQRAAAFVEPDETSVSQNQLGSRCLSSALLQVGGANIAGAGRALKAAAFLTLSQTKNVSARSLVQDSGAPDRLSTAGARSPTLAAGPSLSKVAIFG
jgi:hypothetical protein